MNLGQWPFFDEEQLEITNEILKSGKVNYWTGNYVKKFEEEFSDFFKVKYSVALSNGTVALSLAYKSLGLKKGDQIITTPRTFIATTSSAILNEIKPVFADIDLNSGCITAETIEPLINKNTKCISVVHLGGWPANMDKIKELADSYGISILEDCSQAHGAEFKYKGKFRPVGYLSDISTWSFCQDKIISTGGEGGMISTNRKDLYEYIWSMKDHGKNRNKLKSRENIGSFRWLHDDFGSNYRLTEIQGAIGRIQLKRLEKWNSLRERNAKIIINKIKDISLVRIPIPPDTIRHGWYKLYAYIKQNSLLNGWTRDRIIYEIKEMGFPAFSGSCGEIYLEKSFTKANLAPLKRLPNAKNLSESSLMFLVHPTITENQINDYADAIKNVLLKASK